VVATAVAVAVVVSTAAASVVAVSAAAALVMAVLVVATSAITDSLMMCSLAASAFRGGGAGTIHTDITVTAITRTVIMDTAGTHTATTTDTGDMVTTAAPVSGIAMEAARVMDMAMAAEPVMDPAMAPNQGISRVCGVGDKPGRLFGERPFRVHIDPTEDGAEVVNAVSHHVRAELFVGFGLIDLLTQRNVAVELQTRPA
jgi:hypothetical protein